MLCRRVLIFIRFRDRLCLAFLSGHFQKQRLSELLQALIIVLDQLDLVVQAEELLERVTDLQMRQQGHAPLGVRFDGLDPIMKRLKSAQRQVKLQIHACVSCCLLD